MWVLDAAVDSFHPQTITREFYGLQNGSDRKVAELETKLSEKSTRLEAYEKVERELDDVVMQAAESKFLLPVFL